MYKSFPSAASAGYRGFVMIFCCFCIACGHMDHPAEKPADPPAPETPKALEDGASALEEVRFSKKQVDEDLVEALYQEQAKKDPTLAELEDRLKKLRDHRGDSIKPFDSYNDKNNAYYSSAINHIGTMKDSALRKKMVYLINASDTAYQKMIASHRNLLAGIDAKALTVEDLHTVLKLTRTAAIIEQYQKVHLPGTGPLQHLLKGYGQMGQRMEALSEK